MQLSGLNRKFSIEGEHCNVIVNALSLGGCNMSCRFYIPGGNLQDETKSTDITFDSSMQNRCFKPHGCSCFHNYIFSDTIKSLELGYEREGVSLQKALLHL